MLWYRKIILDQALSLLAFSILRFADTTGQTAMSVVSKLCEPEIQTTVRKMVRKITATNDRPGGRVPSSKRQSIQFLVVIAVLYSMAMPAFADQEFMAAGVLLVAEDNPSPLVFLVRHHSRTWYEMPGGRRQLVGGTDGERRETAYETAIREVFEETRGYLSPDQLRERVDPTRSMRDRGFVFFFGSIERFPVSAIGELAHLDDDSASAFREVADYAWVAVDNILASDGISVIDVNGRSIELRRQLKSRLRGARAAGWL
jgi:8-oxo-dGTP pyrophosphatase MutT (NUDIX family)